MRYIFIIFLIYIYTHIFFDKNPTILKYETKANHGDSKAQYKLAKFYQEGKFTKKNKYLYYHYLKLSAKQNYKWALFELANIYKNKKNYKKAFKLMKKSANQGHIWASYDLALMYFDGIGIKKDYKKAFKYMQLPVLFGYKKAQYAMAKMYYYGYGIKKDTNMAIELLKMAIQQNEPQAMVFLADILLKNNNFQQAMKLYKKATKYNNIDAIYKLATIFLDTNNINKAVKLLTKIKNKSPKARTKLIKIYLYKLNNPKKASQLYNQNTFLKSDFYINPNLKKPILWTQLLY